MKVIFGSWNREQRSLHFSCLLSQQWWNCCFISAQGWNVQWDNCFSVCINSPCCWARDTRYLSSSEESGLLWLSEVGFFIYDSKWYSIAEIYNYKLRGWETIVCIWGRSNMWIDLAKVTIFFRCPVPSITESSYPWCEVYKCTWPRFT